MNFIKEWSGVVALLAVVVIAWVVVIAPRASDTLGTAGGLLAENYLPFLLYNDGYKSEREIVLSGANGDITTGDDLTVTDDATVSGGTLTVTTAANATSSAVLGSIKTYATSSATAVCVRLSTTGATSTFAGGVFFVFPDSNGNCF